MADARDVEPLRCRRHAPLFPVGSQTLECSRASSRADLAAFCTRICVAPRCAASRMFSWKSWLTILSGKVG